MEYVTITKDEQIEFYRNVLIQAESDHLRHSLDITQAQTALDALPANDPGRVEFETGVAQLSKARDTAERLATATKTKLDDEHAPYVKPVEKPSDVESAEPSL